VAVLHFGDHNFACGVRDLGDDVAYLDMQEELSELFAKADFPEVIRAIDDHFGGHGYSLRSLFTDERGKVLEHILERTVDETEQIYRTIYRGRAPLMRFLADLRAGVPAPLRGAAEVVINADLRRELSTAALDPKHVGALIGEAERFAIVLDTDGLSHALTTNVRRQARRIRDLLDEPSLFDDFEVDERTSLARLETLVDVAGWLPFEVDLGDAQEVLWRVLRDYLPGLGERASKGDAAAGRWARELSSLAEKLDVVVPT